MEMTLEQLRDINARYEANKAELTAAIAAALPSATADEVEQYAHHIGRHMLASAEVQADCLHRLGQLTISAEGRAALIAIAKRVAGILTIAENIKEEVARRVVEQAAPGYDTQHMGEWYAVDTDGDNILDSVMHAEATRPWNPWHDNAIAIAVEDCIDSDGNDFDPSAADGVSDKDAFEAAVSFAMDCLLSEIAPEEED